MSKEEHADEIQRNAYYFRHGKDDERTRILNLIDYKIKYYDLDKKTLTDFGRGFFAALEEMKEELNDKK